jgi:hypothetical protein
MRRNQIQIEIEFLHKLSKSPIHADGPLASQEFGCNKIKSWARKRRRYWLKVQEIGASRAGTLQSSQIKFVRIEMLYN